MWGPVAAVEGCIRRPWMMYIRRPGENTRSGYVMVAARGARRGALLGICKATKGAYKTRAGYGACRYIREASI